jgi:orotate phosphoribosyltransferase
VLVDRQEGVRENILKENIDFEAIITKEELLDACYKGTNRERSLSGQSERDDRILQRSL